jgi:ECF sigma factor
MVLGPRLARDPAISGAVTQILRTIQQGDERAAHRLLPLVYDDLRRDQRRSPNPVARYCIVLLERSPIGAPESHFPEQGRRRRGGRP